VRKREIDRRYRTIWCENERKIEKERWREREREREREINLRSREQHYLIFFY
jgi:hypothetical protein